MFDISSVHINQNLLWVQLEKDYNGSICGFEKRFLTARVKHETGLTESGSIDGALRKKCYLFSSGLCDLALSTGCA